MFDQSNWFDQNQNTLYYTVYMEPVYIILYDYIPK